MIPSVNALLLAIVAIVGVFPMAFIVPNTRAIGMVAMMIWVGAHFTKKILVKRFFITTYEVAVYLLLGYLVILSYLSSNITLANRYIEIFGAFVFFIGYRASSLAERRGLLYLILALAAVAYVTTAMELISSPFAARAIKTSDADTINMLRNGVGGYSYIYFIAFLGLIAVGTLMTSYAIGIRIFSMRERFALAIVYLSAIFMAFLSNYLTAIIMLLTAPAVFLLVGQIAKMRAASFVVIVMIAGAVYVFSAQIALIVEGVFESVLGDGWTLERIRTIANYVAYGDSLENLAGARENLGQISLNTALDHPLFGVVVDDYDFASDDFERIGQHSFFLDSAAAFGVLAGVIVVLVSLSPFLSKYNRAHLTIRQLSIYMAIYVFLFFSINNVTTSIGFAVYFVFPFVRDLVDRRWQQMELPRRQGLSAV